MSKKLVAMVVLATFCATVVMSVSSVQASSVNGMSSVKGTVVSYDSDNKRLTVESARGDGQVVVDISSAEIRTSINPGDRVKVFFKEKGNIATMVKPYRSVR